MLSEPPGQETGNLEPVACNFGCSHGCKIALIGDPSLAERAKIHAKRANGVAANPGQHYAERLVVVDDQEIHRDNSMQGGKTRPAEGESSAVVRRALASQFTVKAHPPPSTSPSPCRLPRWPTKNRLTAL
jgi:hypothetical protein